MWIYACLDLNFSWIIRFEEFAYPMIKEFSIVLRVGLTFFLAIVMFGFIFQINYYIIEKEKNSKFSNKTKCILKLY